MDDRDVFELAAEYMRTAKVKVSQEQQLKLYAFFKQATIGPCNAPKPGLLDFVGKAKWEAWNGLASLDGAEAMNLYSSLVETISPGWKESALANSANTSAAQPAGDDEDDFEDDEGGGGGGGGGVKGMGPRVSTMQIEDESGDSSKRDICHFASVNDLQAVKDLLKEGTDINYADEEGQTALHFAADRGHLELMDHLLQAGANVNCKTMDGQTPTHYAAAADNLEACLRLKTAGADLSIEDEDGTTPLDLTASLEIQKLFSQTPS